MCVCVCVCRAPVGPGVGHDQAVPGLEAKRARKYVKHGLWVYFRGFGLLSYQVVATAVGSSCRNSRVGGDRSMRSHCRTSLGHFKDEVSARSCDHGSGFRV